MAKVTYHLRSEHGDIIYGFNPEVGFMVVSGALGPEPYGQPGMTLVDGMELEIDDTGKVIKATPPAPPPASEPSTHAEHSASQYEAQRSSKK